jgi:Tripeptidyl peptidase II
LYCTVQVYDGKKKLLGSGDCFPSAIKTQKGKHTVRIQIKHASISVLESINDMSMQLQRPLKAPIPLTFFLTHSDTLVGTAKMGPRGIAPGGSVSFYCREPNADQVPKGVMPGDTLMGTITYIKKDNSALGCGTKPGGYEVKYVVGDTKIQVPVPAVTPAATSSSPLTIPASAEDSITPALAPSSSDTATATVTPAVTAPGKEKESGIDAAVREAKTKYLKTQIGTQAVFDPLYLTVEAEYPTDLPLKLVGLSHAVKCKSNALAAYKKTPSAETKGEKDKIYQHSTLFLQF